MNIIELTDTQEYEITFNQSLALSLSLDGKINLGKFFEMTKWIIEI